MARSTCALTAGIPVHPMLAKPTRGVREVLERFDGVSFTCEWKYDGERAQVHRTADGTISIFSRNSENTTQKYPDLAVTLAAAMAPTTHSCILDGEVVAYDVEKGTLLPFQVLSKRARKDVTVESISVPAIYAAFDLIYLNGQSLVKLPLLERRRMLHSAFNVVPGRFQFAVSSESNDVEEIATFLNDSVKGGCEGLMVKVLEGPDSVYEPAKRSQHWLKVREAGRRLFCSPPHVRPSISVL
jgi:DNA ligase 1